MKMTIECDSVAEIAKLLDALQQGGARPPSAPRANDTWLGHQPHVSGTATAAPASNIYAVVQCTTCGQTVPLEQAHRVSVLRPDGTVPQGCELLCERCYARRRDGTDHNKSPLDTDVGDMIQYASQGEQR